MDKKSLWPHSSGKRGILRKCCPVMLRCSGHYKPCCYFLQFRPTASDYPAPVFDRACLTFPLDSENSRSVRIEFIFRWTMTLKHLSEVAYQAPLCLVLFLLLYFAWIILSKNANLPQRTTNYKLFTVFVICAFWLCNSVLNSSPSPGSSVFFLFVCGPVGQWRRNATQHNTTGHGKCSSALPRLETQPHANDALWVHVASSRA